MAMEPLRSRHRRPVGPSTVAVYRRLIERAQSVDPSRWPESQRSLLSAALAWRAGGVDGAEQDALLARREALRSTLGAWKPRVVVRAARESEALTYEEAASRLPQGQRAIALLLVLLGLRASEVLNLKRDDVERALEDGELIVMRKGGKEKVMPAGGVQGELRELLATPARERPGTDGEKGAAVRKWKTVGEILSSSPPDPRGASHDARYKKLYRIVRTVGRGADVPAHPHAWRHAFATRMNRDGAPTRTIQAMMGHASITTTERYIHPTASDAAKYMRKGGAGREGGRS